jgi:hypothetical protein
MAIERLTSRPDVSGTAVDTKSASTSMAPRPAHAANANAADAGELEPAATSHLSSGGLILGLMQAYETLHPDQAKAFLHSIADKLHADAGSGDAFAAILRAWGDKFQLAADSGDLSKLLPSMSLGPSPHFGIRAYRAAQQTDDAATIATVFRDSLPPASLDNDLQAATAQLLRTVSEGIRALGAPALGVIDDAALAANPLAASFIKAANEAAAGHALAADETNPLLAEEAAAGAVMQQVRRRYQRQRRRRPRPRIRRYSRPR